MKSALAILAGLLVGVLVAAGVLAAFVFVGPDPVGLRPTPSPSAVPTQVVAASPSIAPSASAPASIAPSVPPSVAPLAVPSTAPSGSAPGSGSPSPSGASQAAYHVGEPAPPLVVVDRLAGAAIVARWARRAPPPGSSPPL